MEIDRFGRRMVELLPQLIRGFARHEHNYLSRGKITLPQLWTLEFLARTGKSPMNRIAQFLSVSRPAATGLIDRLILQGLVLRKEDKKDRRVVQVEITAKGRGILNAIWEQKRRMLVHVFGQISPEDRSQYLSTLEKVVGILRERQPAGKGVPVQR